MLSLKKFQNLKLSKEMCGKIQGGCNTIEKYIDDDGCSERVTDKDGTITGVDYDQYSLNNSSQPNS